MPRTKFDITYTVFKLVIVLKISKSILPPYSMENENESVLAADVDQSWRMAADTQFATAVNYEGTEVPGALREIAQTAWYVRECKRLQERNCGRVWETAEGDCYRKWDTAKDYESLLDTAPDAWVIIEENYTVHTIGFTLQDKPPRHTALNSY